MTRKLHSPPIGCGSCPTCSTRRTFPVSYTHLKHNPEFTTIELYQAFTDFHGMMDLVEELYKRLALKICGSMVIHYQGKQDVYKRQML